jgi:Fe2+-dicitrate sensor, membrane component
MSSNNIDWEKLDNYLNGEHSLPLNEDELAMAQLMLELKANPALLGAAAHTNAKAAWELFQSREIKQEAEPRWWNWKKLAAAAIAVGIVFTVGLWLVNRNDEPQPVSDRIVTPAIDKVTLLLADNRKIELDTATASIQQGIVNISFEKEAAVFRAEKDGPETAGYNTILVPRGKKFRLTLEDGTRIWLNADSRLRFPARFAANKRHVELEGEGYFEVAHATEKPFTVSYKDKTVRVLGTRFNINAYHSSEAVTLLQGSIEWSGLQRNIVLQPGQQVQVQASGVNTRTVKAEDYILWIKNTLLLEQKTVKNLFDEIERHYDIEVRYKGQIPDSIQFNGAFEFPQTLHQMLSLINSTGKVTAIMKEHYVLVEQSDR